MLRMYELEKGVVWLNTQTIDAVRADAKRTDRTVLVRGRDRFVVRGRPVDIAKALGKAVGK